MWGVLENPALWAFLALLYVVWTGFKGYDKRIASLQKQIDFLQAKLDNQLGHDEYEIPRFERS